jgi:hypothetical protein
MVVGLNCSESCSLVGDVRRIETLVSAVRVINPYRDCFTCPFFYLKLIQLFRSLELSVGRGCRYV